MSREIYIKQFDTVFSSSTCYQQFIMEFMVLGYELSDSDHIYNLRIFMDRLLHTNFDLTESENNELRNKYKSFISEMLMECDLITEKNISRFSILVCSIVLDSSDKKFIMPAFKYLCDHFPKEMVHEYMKQKLFKKYCI